MIVYPNVNYCVLAEITGKAALAVKEGADDGELYLIGIDEEDSVQVGQSLRAAVLDARWQ